MPNLMTPSNAWWLIGGIALALPGLWLLVRALFADRARGRRRCPKCWYELGPGNSGNRPTCPECGHRVKRARQLRRTRRRWRWVAPATVIVIVGAAFAVGPHVNRRRLFEHTPTAMFIIALPWIEDRQGDTAVTLLGRLQLTQQPFTWPSNDPPPDLGLARLERRLLVLRCRAALVDDAPLAARDLSLYILEKLGPDAAPALDRVVATMGRGESETVKSGVRIVRACEHRGHPWAPELAAMLHARGLNDATLPVIGLIGSFGPAGAPAVPVITEHMSSFPAYDRTESAGFGEGLQRCRRLLDALYRIGPDAARAQAVVARHAGEDSPLRVQAVATLAAIGTSHDDACDAVLAALLEWEPTLREIAASAAATDPACCERAIEALRPRLASRDSFVRSDALRTIGVMGPAAAEALPAVRAALDDADPGVRLLALFAIETIGPDAETLERVRALRGDDDWIVRRAVVRVLTLADP